jgi:transposase-like protein
MPRKGYTVEEIISRLREAEILIQQGHTIGETARKIGVSEYTYYRWRQRYGGIGVDQARKLKELEKENARLKKVVADLTIDNDILKEVARGNF